VTHYLVRITSDVAQAEGANKSSGMKIEKGDMTNVCMCMFIKLRKINFVVLWYHETFSALNKNKVNQGRKRRERVGGVN